MLDSLARRARYAIGESEAADNHPLRFDEEPSRSQDSSVDSSVAGNGAEQATIGRVECISKKIHNAGDKDQYGPEGPVSSL